MSLAGKLYLVTGVASGIGASTARALLDAGARVIGMDLREPDVPCERFVAFDQGDPGSIDAAVAALDIPLDGLCNVAGVPPREALAPAELLMINFYGLRRLTRGLAEHFNDCAAIVNVASGAGMKWASNMARVRAFLAIADDDPDAVASAVEAHGIHNAGMASDAAYPFSKELVIAWTMKHSRAWLERRIRINAVSPGAIRTPILDDFLANFGSAVEERLRVFGPGTPEQVAQVILFLLSPQADWVNGANLAVDGGSSASVQCERFDL